MSSQVYHGDYITGYVNFCLNKIPIWVIVLYEMIPNMQKILQLSPLPRPELRNSEKKIRGAPKFEIRAKN